jgi:hypothetical protein
MNTLQVGGAAKDRRNRSRYTQVKVSVAPDVAAAFKSACVMAGTSMASEIGGFMNARSGRLPDASRPLPDVSTRRRRRKEVKDLLLRLKRILEAEERYRDNIPENLQGSAVGDSADNIIELLSDVICSLEDVYP